MKKLLASTTAMTATVAMLTVGAQAADSAAMKKIGPALSGMYQLSQTDLQEFRATQSTQATRPESDLFLGSASADGFVLIDAVASGNASDLVATIESLGGRNVASYGRKVSAEVPMGRLADLGASNYLAFAMPTLNSTNVGLVTTQGDRSMNTDTVRDTFDLDGSNVRVGVLSDSFSCEPGSLAGGPFTTTAEDIANDDLPAEIVILDDFLDTTACIDEGRGMAQLIHDVVPAASIAFHTAFNGQADFAQGIIELAVQAGSDVIVDDVIYFAEPMFQDGVIAQAADEVARLGIPYYSSNGNRARDSFQSEYRPVAFDGSTFHDFDPGPGEDPLNTIVLGGALQTNLAFNWDSPNFSVSGAPGAQNDVDVVMFDANGVRVADCFDANGVFVPPVNGLCQFQFTDGGVPIDGGNGGDAIELVSLVDFIGGSEVQIGFETQSGDPAGFVKFVIFGGSIASAEYAIDAPSGFGHNNAAGAEGVGAAAFYFTEEFVGDPSTLQLRAQAGEPECDPACLNDFSSAGGTPIFFDVAGNRLAEPEIRFKPGITGPDGGNTSFFFSDTSRDDDDGDGVFETGEEGEFPNFFGTSASAPHIAALAALMVDAEDSQIRRIRRDGQVRFNMCRPDDDDDEGREDGDSRRVRPDRVENRISRGWLLGNCDRTEPQKIYQIMRNTADDMTVRADNGTGATLQVFDEVGPRGFDFDSGFGFVNGERAMRRFINQIDDDDDDDDDGDDD